MFIYEESKAPGNDQQYYTSICNDCTETYCNLGMDLSMLPHLLLNTATFAMTMGVQPLHGAPRIAIDTQTYVNELALKYALLADNHRYYFQAFPESEAMQWEALGLILPELAAQ